MKRSWLTNFDMEKYAAMKTQETIEAKVQKIDALLSKTYKADGTGVTPGAGVAIYWQGKVILSKGYGLANVELGVPVGPNMVFRVGSVSKQFTAVAILLLEEQGKLSVKDDIHKFLPDYPTYGQTITVEHLLTHTSGIANYTALPKWFPMWRQDLPLEELIGIFKDEPLDFNPDEGWNYSNSAFVLLGAIVEKASGMLYEDFVNQNIFKKVGMDSACYDHTERIIKNRVSGYEWNPAEKCVMNCSYLSMTQPHAAGSLAMSVQDLMKWYPALAAGKVITPASLKKAHTSYKGMKSGEDCHYGYGWGVFERDGHKYVRHGGGINGFICDTTYLPNDDLAIVVLTNMAVAEDGPNYLTDQIIGILFDKELKEYQVIKLPDAVMDEYVGVYEKSTHEAIVTRSGDALKLELVKMGELMIKPVEKDLFKMGAHASGGFTFKRGPDGKVLELVGDVGTGPNMIFEKTDKPLPEARKSVEIDPTKLGKFVGAYELAPGMTMEVFLEGTKMWAQVPGQDKIELFAASELVFFPTAIKAELSFIQDESGKISGMNFTQGAMKMMAKKIK